MAFHPFFDIFVPCNPFLLIMLFFTEDESTKVICPIYHQKDKNLQKSPGKKKIQSLSAKFTLLSKLRYL